MAFNNKDGEEVTYRKISETEALEKDKWGLVPLEDGFYEKAGHLLSSLIEQYEELRNSGKEFSPEVKTIRSEIENLKNELSAIIRRRTGKILRNMVMSRIFGIITAGGVMDEMHLDAIMKLSEEEEASLTDHEREMFTAVMNALLKYIQRVLTATHLLSSTSRNMMPSHVKEMPLTMETTTTNIPTEDVTDEVKKEETVSWETNTIALDEKEDILSRYKDVIDGYKFRHENVSEGLTLLYVPTAAPLDEGEYQINLESCVFLRKGDIILLNDEDATYLISTLESLKTIEFESDEYDV